jgi:hypothetical protein
MWEKIKSRKFLITVVAGLVVTLNKELGFGLTEESVLGLAGIVAAYLGVQGWQDVKKESK